MAGQMNLPSGFGGLTRFSEEYKSKLMITPTQVIVAVVAVIAFVISLRIFFPIK